MKDNTDTNAMRRIVHIAVSGEECPVIVAVCADGTAWKILSRSIGPNQWRYEWEKLPAIPARD